VYATVMLRKTLIFKLNKEAKERGISHVAQDIGINYFQLYRIMNGITKGTIDTWEKIIKYYNK
jgi:DNA-binding phage protein